MTIVQMTDLHVVEANGRLPNRALSSELQGALPGTNLECAIAAVCHRRFAEHQPVSLMVNVVRGLLLNQPDASTIWQALAWCMGILVVFIPLAVWAYGRRTVR